MLQKVVILGAGVGGLTVAHELVNSRHKKYQIEIFERNATIGGMARSGYKKWQNILLPTEYCWRIYGPNYDNLREILKEIPLTDNPKKSVHDNLVNIYNYLIADQNTVLLMNNRPKTLFDIRKAFSNIPFKQKKNVIKKILYGFMISTDRLNKLDQMTWVDYINPDNNFCHDMQKYIIDIMAPYLGAESRKVNVPSVIKTLESFKLLNGANSVMGAPTNEAWFDHWKIYLENKGVIFHLNTEVKDLNIENEKVKSIELSDGQTVSGEEFFCALPIESVAKFQKLNMPSLKELAKRAHQLMVGIQLYFDKKIELPHEHTALYIPDSPWQLVIEPQGSIWKKSFPPVSDIWSIGLCDPVKPGHLTKKPFVQCSPLEIKNEVWHQINNSEFGQFLKLSAANIIDYHLWDSYVFDGSTLKTNEPKFSTNVGTHFLRPQNKTYLSNFYFATAYTQTDTDMFEMESAAESGRRAAKLIDESTRVIPCDRTLFFKFYRWIDSIFSKQDIYKNNTIIYFMIGLPFLIFILPVLYLKKFLKI